MLSPVIRVKVYTASWGFECWFAPTVGLMWPPSMRRLSKPNMQQITNLCTTMFENPICIESTTRLSHQS
jgi:hypothetical protein